MASFGLVCLPGDSFCLCGFLQFCCEYMSHDVREARGLCPSVQRHDRSELECLLVEVSCAGGGVGLGHSGEEDGQTPVVSGRRRVSCLQPDAASRPEGQGEKSLR